VKAANVQLRERIAQICQQDGVILDDTLHGDVMSMMNDHTRVVHQKQMRWHPQVIRWCLHLRLVCGGGYRLLRESGLIKLPSERTLRDYTHYVPPQTGFQDAVPEQLAREAKLNEIALPTMK